jgi:hypothetical protein
MRPIEHPGSFAIHAAEEPGCLNSLGRGGHGQLIDDQGPVIGLIRTICPWQVTTTSG